MTDRKLRVFLCHSSEDKIAVRDFYNLLSAESWIDPWLDEENILPGMNWEVEIKEAVRTADAVIVFLSRNSVNKEGYVQYELNLVLDAGSKKPQGAIFVIPLKLDQCEVPLRIRSIQHIDFSLPEASKQSYTRLIKSLKIRDDIVNNRTGKTDVAHYVSPSNIQRPAVEAQDIKPESRVMTLEFGGFKFVKIPKGKFIMGSKASNPLACENEIPQYPCTIPYDYWISRFPVSNEQFSEFAFSTRRMVALSKDWREKLNCPIVNVSWQDAISYAHWLNEVFDNEIPGGMEVRLPTEAEWERAARGDSAFTWPWGNESLDELLRKKGLPQIINEIEISRSTLKPVDVSSFSPWTDSPFGVADMMGSVFEWTHSLFASYPYDTHDGRENLEVEGKRVIRGYFDPPKQRFSVRSARRHCLTPDKKAPVLGFRVVVAPPIL